MYSTVQMFSTESSPSTRKKALTILLWWSPMTKVTSSIIFIHLLTNRSLTIKCETQAMSKPLILTNVSRTRCAPAAVCPEAGGGPGLRLLPEPGRGQLQRACGAAGGALEQRWTGWTEDRGPCFGGQWGLCGWQGALDCESTSLCKHETFVFFELITRTLEHNDVGKWMLSIEGGQFTIKCCFLTVMLQIWVERSMKNVPICLYNIYKSYN